jgi:hypothetical protein
MIPGYAGLKVCAFLLLKCVRDQGQHKIAFKLLKKAYAAVTEAQVVAEGATIWDNMKLVDFTLNQTGVFELYEANLKGIFREAELEEAGVQKRSS